VENGSQAPKPQEIKTEPIITAVIAPITPVVEPIIDITSIDRPLFTSNASSMAQYFNDLNDFENKLRSY